MVEQFTPSKDLSMKFSLAVFRAYLEFRCTTYWLEWNNSELIAEETMMQDEQGLDSKRTTMLHEQLRKILAQLPD